MTKKRRLLKRERKKDSITGKQFTIILKGLKQPNNRDIMGWGWGAGDA